MRKMMIIVVFVLLLTGCGNNNTISMSGKIYRTFSSDIKRQYTIEFMNENTCSYTTLYTGSSDSVASVWDCTYSIKGTLLTIYIPAQYTGYDFKLEYTILDDYSFEQNSSDLVYKLIKDNNNISNVESNNDINNDFVEEKILSKYKKVVEITPSYDTSTCSSYDWCKPVKIDICENKNLDELLKKLSENYNVTIYLTDFGYTIRIANDKGSVLLSLDSYTDYYSSTIAEDILEFDKDGNRQYVDGFPGNQYWESTSFICTGVVEKG